MSFTNQFVCTSGCRHHLWLQLTFPKPDDWANPDRVQYGTKSIIGASGTYNHLTDALLDVTAARAMYMRRLRTLADKYYGQGKLRQVGCICKRSWFGLQHTLELEYVQVLGIAVRSLHGVCHNNAAACCGFQALTSCKD